MKSVIVLMLSLIGVACAQENQPKTQPRSTEKKRLESVTWNLRTRKLVWVVARGTVQNGSFVPTATDNYEISPEDATMSYGKERRGFTADEAASLHKLLDTLSLYCAESVVWWDKGEGDRLDKPGQGSADRQKVARKNRGKTPVRRDELVAALSRRIAETLR